MHLPPELDSEDFRTIWEDWKAYRIEEKRLKPYKERGERAQLSRISKWGEKRAIEAIEFSMAQGYEGIWEDPSRRANSAPSIGSWERKHEDHYENLEQRIAETKMQVEREAQGQARAPHSVEPHRITPEIFKRLREELERTKRS